MRSILFSLALTGCTGGSIPPVVAPTVETAICILNVATKDAQQGKSPGEVVADCIQVCGADAATIARVLDGANALQMARSGYDAGAR